MDNSKQHPLVSIGVPVYDVELFIEKCLLSIFNQTYDNLEILIVDDCGHDKSMEIVYGLQKNHHNGNLIRVVKQPYSIEG